FLRSRFRLGQPFDVCAQHAFSLVLPYLRTKEPMTKYVYFFGGGKADGRADMKELLGGKGANLAEMTNIGLPVPAGFTLSTEVCTYFYQHGRKYPAELRDQV